MKLKINLSPIVLSILLSSLTIPFVLAPVVSAQTEDTKVALQRGYRTGYSDGYMSGYRDVIDSLGRDYARHNEYKKADRAYNKDYGTVEEYRDGYQQGFERGYDTGFERRSFEAALPTELKRRGAVTNDSQTATTTTGNTQTSGGTTGQTDTSASNIYQSANAPIILIPRDTELILELQDDLSSDHSRAGDKFTAKIVSPSEIAGATIEGRIAKIAKVGRLKRHSEMSLSFDRIVLSDNRWTNFSAMLVEVMPVKGDNVKTVDSEGTAIGKDSLKSDGIKVGAAAGTGLVVGAVVGGPAGAAIGAGVGAAFGVGAVVIQRGKQIKLNRNQQLRIKTAYETQIR
jgi:hypothetical protein